MPTWVAILNGASVAPQEDVSATTLSIGEILSHPVVMLAIAGGVLALFKWMGGIDADRKGFQKFTKGVRDDFKEVREDIKEILSTLREQKALTISRGSRLQEDVPTVVGGCGGSGSVHARRRPRFPQPRECRVRPNGP